MYATNLHSPQTIGSTADHHAHFCVSLNRHTHLHTNELLMACSTYKTQSCQISGSFMFFTFKKQIPDHISHAMGFSIFLNIIYTRQCDDIECLQIVSVPCQRINKLGTHVLIHDCSAAVAIFANGTYFLDNPHIW